MVYVRSIDRQSRRAGHHLRRRLPQPRQNGFKGCPLQGRHGAKTRTAGTWCRRVIIPPGRHVQPDYDTWWNRQAVVPSTGDRCCTVQPGHAPAQQWCADGTAFSLILGPVLEPTPAAGSPHSRSHHEDKIMRMIKLTSVIGAAGIALALRQHDRVRPRAGAHRRRPLSPRKKERRPSVRR